MIQSNRNYVIGLLYMRQVRALLTISNQGCIEAMNWQLSFFEESPLTAEEIKMIEQGENDMWFLLKSQGYNHSEQRENRKKIAKLNGGRYENGVIKLD